MLLPSYIAGCIQWLEIKTNVSFIHAARMRFVPKLAATIRRFVDCILSAQYIASASIRMLSTAVNTFSSHTN